MQDKKELKYRHSILVLDDEPGILNAVKRLLRKLPCEYTITTDPNEALDKIKNKKPPFSLIISDQRMPLIKGADFLKMAKEASPYSIRYLITGYTDMDALIDAINKGGIHRFIAKPWDDEDFVKIISEGLMQYELILENKRLLALVAKQNKELNAVKERLEIKVKQRTIEITEKNRHLESRNQELLESLYNTIRSLDTMIGTLDKDLSLHGQRVSEISILLGMELKMSSEDMRNLEIAALLHDIGRIGNKSEGLLESQEFCKLDNSDSYRNHPIKGQDILEYIPQLKKCGKIIRHHHENYDGSGFPDGLEEKKIPVESRIIAIANTYDKLHLDKKRLDSLINGYLNAKQLSRDSFARVELIENAIMHYLQQNTFSLFDPDLLKIMLDLIKNKKIKYRVEIEIAPDELQPGDVLSKPVYTQSGNLVFQKETLINHRKIDKIKEVIKHDTLKDSIRIIEDFGALN